jgi:cell division protein FtsB
MTQRRTPSGQGPSRRAPGGQTGRPGGRGTTRTRDTASTRIEPRVSVTRVSPARGTRGTERPAAARRTGATGATKRTVATRPKAFTGRATVLIIVLVALALAYTYPVRVYLAQESQIGRMESAQTAQRQRINAKIEEVAKWQDPEYVRIQARDRLFYVRPGEVPLLVLNDPAGAARDAGKAAPAAPAPAWFDTLWSSVAAANAEPRN